MKKILLFLIFGWMIGILPLHASAQEAFQPYPYPPQVSTGVENLPQGFNTIILGDEIFYYYDGTFYRKVIVDDKYIRVSPPIGAVVRDLPSAYQYMYINGRAYYVSGGVYYGKVLNGYRVIFPPPGA